MTWENDFSQDELEKGMKLYQSGRVKRFHCENDYAQATVNDRYTNYLAEAYEYKGQRHYTCRCMHYGSENCAHVAALMFAWKGPSADFAEQNAVVPVFREDEFKDCWFDPAKAIAACHIKQRMYDEACALLTSGDLHIEAINYGYQQERFSTQEQVLQISATAVSNKYDYDPEISLTLGRDRIIAARCGACGGYYYDNYYRADYRLCPHILALLLKAGEYIKEYNPGDETNFSGEHMLEQFSRIRQTKPVSTPEELKKCIHLSPILYRDFNSLSLGFRIGINKPYILKNCHDMVRACEAGESFSLGKNNDLHFHDETFADDSRAFYSFIAERVKEAESMSSYIESRARSYYSVPDLTVRSKIDLNGTALDRFYDLSAGRTIDYEYDDGRKAKEHLTIGDIPYRYHLTINEMSENNIFTGIELTGEKMHFFSGSDHRYFIRDSHFSRLSQEDYRILTPFLTDTQDDHISIRIGKKNLSEFYYRILPMLRENPVLDIEENHTEQLEKNLPPEAKFTFYLDLDDDTVYCNAQVLYDNTICTLGKKTPGVPYETFRDLRLEQNVRETVLDYFPARNEQGLFISPRSDDTLYDLLENGLRELSALGTVNGSDAFTRLKIRRVPAVHVGVSVTSSLMDLEVTTQEMTPEELLSLLSSYQQKKKFHRLNGDEFISLEQNESLDTLTAMMDAMNISVQAFVEGKLHLPLYRALYVNRMLEDHESLSADRDKNFRNLVRTFSTIKDSEYDVPEELQGVLRNYQEYGYKWLHTLTDMGFGGILADDMGLGKTLQAITLILAAKKENRLDAPALIVCPTSVVYNWQEECARFAPQLTVLPVVGKPEERKAALEAGTDVLITSYDLLKRDIGNYDGHRFSFQFLDEAQFIKNHKAAVSKAVRIIQSDHRFALTGTPIENRLSELWSIFDYLMPGFLYTYENFRSWYETPITRDKDEYTTGQLRRMVSPFILRRLKEDVLKDLPEKMEEVRYARFDEEQQKIYDAQVVHMKEMVNAMDENSGEGKIKILAELTKIRQICCDPSLLLDDYRGESTKRQACMELIESAIEGRHKILLFSQFTSMLELLEADLEKAKISYYKLTGSTSKEDRMKYVHQFNEDETPVFLISLKAGGTGLNLTGADIVIHYDPWWNLAAQNQATDRAHRIGQTKKVSVFKLIVKDSIEEKILEMQEAKKDLSDAILSGETTSITSLSREELLELLG